MREMASNTLRKKACNFNHNKPVSFAAMTNCFNEDVRMKQLHGSEGQERAEGQGRRAQQ
jgi:hypothetical protein